MAVYYLDGRYVDSETTGMPFDDLGLLRGYGVFDFLRTYGGKPFFLHVHLERLISSAEQIGLAVPWTVSTLSEIVTETLSRNRFAEAHIRILVTGGGSEDFITPAGKPRLVVMITPQVPIPDKWVQSGVKIITTSHERFLPSAKTINYIPAILALKKAAEEGAVEAVYVTHNRRVLEGTTSNLFAFIGDHLVTPQEGVLDGVTRRVVLHITRPLFDVRLRPILTEELHQAAEVFLSSSNKEVVPVTQIDGQAVGDGQPGPRTRQVMAAFKAYTATYAQNGEPQTGLSPP